MSGKPRIGILDIEVSPNLATTWGLRIPSGYLGHENIQQERYIICAAWKWLGEREVFTSTILDGKPKFGARIDKPVVSKLIRFMNEADAIVAHNGESFDVPWIRTRAMIHKMVPPKPVPVIDTKVIAKRGKLYFNSARLDYLGKILVAEQKIKTDFDLWLRVLQFDPAAIDEMRTYNIQDVKLLEKVYERLQPYVQGKINALSFIDDPELASRTCPKPNCGKPMLVRKGYIHTTTGQRQNFQCRACGGWCSRPLNSKVQR